MKLFRLKEKTAAPFILNKSSMNTFSSPRRHRSRPISPAEPRWLGNPQEFTVEKLIYGGDGLARMAPRPETPRADSEDAPETRSAASPSGPGQAVFIAGALPGERVRAALFEKRSGFARARLVQVMTPSPARVHPPCPYFGECGGCQWQHLDYAGQLEWKASILRETLHRFAGYALAPEKLGIHSAEPWGYRNRARWRVLPAREGRLELGYRRAGQNRAVGVAECGLLAPELAAVFSALRRLAAPPAGLLELEAAVNEAGQAQVTGHVAAPAAENTELARWLESAAQALPGRAAAALAGPDGVQNICGSGALECGTGGFQYRVSPGVFFQVNRFLLDALVQKVTGGIEGERALDLFSGVGLFSLPLSRGFGWVSAVEAQPRAARDLEFNAERAQAPVHVSAIPVAEFLARSARGYDLAVADPPRAGLGPEVVSHLLRLRPARIHYLACDPVTQARDLRGLLAAGYQVETAELFDLFPQTYHLESLLKLRL